MRKQAEELFPDVTEQEAFLEALVEGGSKEQAIVVLDDKPEIGAFPKQRPFPWQPDFVVRILGDFRPTKHALYAKGAYYSMDFSSAFAASVMLGAELPRRVLDLCSSPGGKAIFSWRAFRPELLVCNETIRKRCKTLIDNLKRCHAATSCVSSADPSVWAKKASEAFDLVIVDAPCSGQSLLAKGEEAEGCFHPNMIDMCVGRQRRIVGNAVRCLAPGGYLLYMTCTFAKKENEKLVEWALRHGDVEVEPVAIPGLAGFQSRYSDAACYRIFPQSGIGAGAFAALLRRPGERPEVLPDLADLPIFWRYGEER
jgi:16S rRNA C967 or C1407 C5-methylase (RsmB/RsmF family)